MQTILSSSRLNVVFKALPQTRRSSMVSFQGFSSFSFVLEKDILMATRLTFYNGLFQAV